MLFIEGTVSLQYCIGIHCFFQFWRFRCIFSTMLLVSILKDSMHNLYCSLLHYLLVHENHCYVKVLVFIC